MQLVTILAGQQQLRIETVFHHVRRAPFGTNHGVLSQVPPEVICKLLGAAILFPRALQFKGIRIHEKKASRPVSVGRSERASIDAVRAAMNRMRRGVASLPDELLGLDHL